MLMNIKETIISSFFFHIIQFLLMLAVSYYTTGYSGDVRKIITLDLAMKENTEQPEALSNSTVQEPLKSNPSSDEGISLPDQSVNKQPEEPVIIPEPQKQPEAPTDPAKIEKRENLSLQKEGFSSMEAYYQFIILHKKIFAQQAEYRVNKLLSEAFKVNTREFFGGTALVRLTFGPEGRVNAVSVDSESPSLKAFFEEISWDLIPPPSAYSLAYTKVLIEFTVHEGFMSFRVNPL